MTPEELSDWIVMRAAVCNGRVTNTLGVKPSEHAWAEGGEEWLRHNTGHFARVLSALPPEERPLRLPTELLSVTLTVRLAFANKGPETAALFLLQYLAEVKELPYSRPDNPRESFAQLVDAITEAQPNGILRRIQPFFQGVRMPSNWSSD